MGINDSYVELCSDKGIVRASRKASELVVSPTIASKIGLTASRYGPHYIGHDHVPVLALTAVTDTLIGLAIWFGLV